MVSIKKSNSVYYPQFWKGGIYSRFLNARCKGSCLNCKLTTGFDYEQTQHFYFHTLSRKGNKQQGHRGFSNANITTFLSWKYAFIWSSTI